MPFGLSSASGAMEAIMRHELRDLLVTGGMDVYLDDILVYADTQLEHDAILARVLTRLEDWWRKLFPNAVKCTRNR